MGLMDLLAGGQQQSDFRDFTQRYERGAPYDGFDHREAYDRHQQVARNVSSDEYERAARETFARMSPQERRDVGRELRSRSHDAGYMIDRDGDGRDDRYEDPNVLAGMVGGLHRQQPDLLGQLLGAAGGAAGGGGLAGGLGQMLGGAGGAGGAGAAANPLAKVALGGIAAMAAKQFLNQR